MNLQWNEEYTLTRKGITYITDLNYAYIATSFASQGVSIIQKSRYVITLRQHDQQYAKKIHVIADLLIKLRKNFVCTNLFIVHSYPATHNL